jgi:hypothetical protein
LALARLLLEAGNAGSTAHALVLLVALVALALEFVAQAAGEPRSETTARCESP